MNKNFLATLKKYTGKYEEIHRQQGFGTDGSFTIYGGEIQISTFGLSLVIHCSDGYRYVPVDESAPYTAGDKLTAEELDQKWFKELSNDGGTTSIWRLI